jgi:type IV secretory pathway VirD2 relaxase
MESDLGTRLDWVGIAHWNTDNPHVHLVVRGVADDGSNLVISRDYISHGLRARAADLGRARLKPEHEIRSTLAREVEAERWTRLDAAIRKAADDSASSTCGWTIRVSTIHRRAVSPSAVCRSWSAWVSPRLQGRANE